MLVGFCAPSVRAACRAHAVRPKAALPGSSSYRYLPKADPFLNLYFVRWKCLPALPLHAAGWRPRACAQLSCRRVERLARAMAALPPTSLCIAYGSRGVDKLIETLASPDVETQRFTLTTLNTLLSNQENKLKALSERLQLVWTLVTLLGSDDNEVKRQTALALASLGLLYQGRLAIGEAGAVRELSGLLVDSGETGVREACSSALLALSEVCARAPRTAHRPSLCAPACPPHAHRSRATEPRRLCNTCGARADRGDPGECAG